MPIEVAIFLGILVLSLAPIFLLSSAFKGSKKRTGKPGKEADPERRDWPDQPTILGGTGLAMGAGHNHHPGSHDSSAASHGSGSSTDFGSDGGGGGGDGGGGGGGGGE